jgi:(2Fe-2S) ferredoxin
MISASTESIITGFDDLQKRRDRFLKGQAGIRHTVLVCAGAGCVSCDCTSCSEALEASLREAGLSQSVQVRKTGCMGICDAGPIMVVQPDDVLYCKLRPEDMPEIVHRHFLEGQIAVEHCFVDPGTGQPVERVGEIPFFSKQHKIVLKNCGRTAFDDLDDISPTRDSKPCAGLFGI